MKPLVYTYEDSEKQTVYFRGYVKHYQEDRVLITCCHDVRTNKGAALRDAHKLMKEIKLQHAHS